MNVASLATAALRFPWAISVFSAQEFMNGVRRPTAPGSARTLTDLYTVTEASQAQFESNAFLFAAYQIGDQAQRAVTDSIYDALTLKIFDPRYLRERGTEFLDTSVGALRSLGTDEGRGITYQTARNKFEVIGLVNGVDERLGIPDRGNIDLQNAVAEAYALGNYPALWAIEGLGESFARNALQVSEDPIGLLTDGQGAILPEKTMLMMHAGIGIAFAKKTIAKLNPYSDAAAIDRTMMQFIALVTANSRPGYEGAALESMGLVTRTWHGQMVNLVSASLQRVDPDARDFFWHGAGRSMYFHPMNMIPGFSPWRQSASDPPDELARLNARAGVAWAFSLVNMRQPEIVAATLRQNENEISRNDGYSNGVLSTSIMAGDMVPGHKYVADFGGWQPDAASASTWRRFVGADFAERVNLYRDNLRVNNKLGEVFRYHRLADFSSANLDLTPKLDLSPILDLSLRPDPRPKSDTILIIDTGIGIA